MSCVMFFFFKQETDYEMRISDWSSDVCSSDRPDEHRHNPAMFYLCSIRRCTLYLAVACVFGGKSFPAFPQSTRQDAPKRPESTPCTGDAPYAENHKV